MTPVIERFEKEYQSYHDLSPKRRKEQLKELRLFAEFVGKDSPEECTAQDLRSYMAELVDLELHVNTVRKRGNMIRPFFTWSFNAGLVSGDELMAVRAVENPKGSTNRSKPKPYSAKELKRFWVELDERWPFREERWWKRWRDGRSKYKRIATHVMRLQMEAIISLALDCGLRLSEIYHLDINDMHHDNEFIIVRPRTERDNEKNRMREVPADAEDRRLAASPLPPHLRDELAAGRDGPGGRLPADRAREPPADLGLCRHRERRHRQAGNEERRTIPTDDWKGGCGMSPGGYIRPGWEPMVRRDQDPDFEWNPSVSPELRSDECWMNNRYQCLVKYCPAKDPDAPMLKKLSIHLLDRSPMRNWRHLQQIKNEVCGELCTGIEVFPPEDALTDTANEYHLWVFPAGVDLGFGLGPCRTPQRTAGALGAGADHRAHRAQRGRACQPGGAGARKPTPTDQEGLMNVWGRGYPDATPEPCNDCPWRRVATPGWLGPYLPSDWIKIVHGESPIACHQTIRVEEGATEGDWDDPKMRQCRGAAIFRANVAKSPKHPDIVTGPADEESCFGSNEEFLEHHGGEPMTPIDLYAPLSNAKYEDS